MWHCAKNVTPDIPKLREIILIFLFPNFFPWIFPWFFYNKNNKFKGKEKIHNSIIQLESRSNKPKIKFEQTIHSHVLSDYINSTDICTLLLYKDYVEWKKHIVISKKQVSIFDLEKESLFTMTRKAWDKVYSNEQN